MIAPEIGVKKRSKAASTSGLISDVAVLILTFNEEPNIGRTLDALTRFPEVVVLDSGSQDATCEIAARYPNVRIATRPFDQHSTQWNYGLTMCGITRPWVLALDADFVVSEHLVAEIAALEPDPLTAGFYISFRYCVLGRPLSAALYPPLVAFYRRERAYYIQEGHTQRVVVDGRLLDLSGRINHDDRKPLSRWLASQQKYARLEAEYLLKQPTVRLRTSDQIRLLGWPAPIVVFAYTLIAKRCILDGWYGWFYVLQRSLAECMIALEIVERRLRDQRRE